jgi:hypothetical protein
MSCCSSKSDIKLGDCCANVGEAGCSCGDGVSVPKDSVCCVYIHVYMRVCVYARVRV